MRNRKITFTNVGVIQGSRVWRNSETGVEIIKGKNFAEVGLYYVCHPTQDRDGRAVGFAVTSMAEARKMGCVLAERVRAARDQAHHEARLEDADRDAELNELEAPAGATYRQALYATASREGALAYLHQEAIREDKTRSRSVTQRTIHYRIPELGYQACGEMYSSDGLTEVRSEVNCQRCRDRYNSDYWEQATAGMPRVSAFTEATR